MSENAKQPTFIAPPSNDLQVAAGIIGSYLHQSAQAQADASKAQGVTAIEIERLRTERFNKSSTHSLIIWLVVLGLISGTMAAAFAYGQYQIATHVLTAALGALGGWGARSAKIGQ